MIEFILVVVVIVLIYAAYRMKLRYDEEDEEKAPETFTQRRRPKQYKVTPEQRALGENLEYFEDNHGTGAAGAGCSTKYSDNLYGVAGDDYVDYVRKHSVEAEVEMHHREFVKDRLSGQAENQIITGRTYSPDSHQSYDPIPWVGLMRPQAVPIGDPDQVPDVDLSLYSTKRTLRW